MSLSSFGHLDGTQTAARRTATEDVLRGLWAVSILVCAGLLVASIWLTPERLDEGALAWVGACPARLAGQPCILCGMSHSFTAMASMRWQAAAQFNISGPCLFFLVLLNTFAGLLWAIRWLVRTRAVRGAEWES